jgi:dTDP-4-dehydrorhamnose 3,5-epimerase-like enzyme
MEIIETNIKDVKIIKPNVYKDEPGIFLNLLIKTDLLQTE